MTDPTDRTSTSTSAVRRTASGARDRIDALATAGAVDDEPGVSLIRERVATAAPQPGLPDRRS